MNSSSPSDERNWTRREVLEYLAFVIGMVLAAAALIAQ